MGWRITAAVLLLWSGTTDHATLCDGLDPGSKEVVRLLLDSDPHDDEAPQAGAVPKEKSGALRKMAKGPKGHDYLQSVAVELSATGGLSWIASSASGDPAGSQEDLAPGEMLSVASCSSTGAEHAFEVVSCVKGTNAPPVHHQFVAQSESECGDWIAAVRAAIEASLHLQDP